MRIPFGFFAGANRGNLLVVGTSSSPFIGAYPWQHGFGTKYANPGTIRSAVTGMDVHPNGNSMVAVGAASPYLWGYVTDFSISGNLSVPTPPSFAQQNIRYSLDGSIALISGKSGSSSGYLAVYSVESNGNLSLIDSTTNGAISTYSDAVLAPDNTGFFVSTSVNTTTGIRYHAWDGVTIGNDSNTFATGTAWAQLEMHPNDTLLLARSTSGNISAYPKSGLSFGTPFSPASGIAATQMTIGGDNNDVLFLTSASTPFIQAFPMTSGSFGTKYADPTFLPGASTAVSYNAAQKDVVVSTSGNPIGYPWSNASGFGTRYASPATSTSNGTRIKLV